MKKGRLVFESGLFSVLFYFFRSLQEPFIRPKVRKPSESCPSHLLKASEGNDY